MTAKSLTRQHLRANFGRPLSGHIPEWVSLGELGRPYGLSAMEIGRLLVQDEWRDANGEATIRALAKGMARRLPSGQNHSAIWHRKGCALWLESRQLLRRQPDRIGLWAELLAALDQGEPAIAESAQEMALEIPCELVSSVNAALRSKGCRFQVHRTSGAVAREAPAPRQASQTRWGSPFRWP